jgi:hypothetical protein
MNHLREGLLVLDCFYPSRLTPKLQEALGLLPIGSMQWSGYRLTLMHVCPFTLRCTMRYPSGREHGLSFENDHLVVTQRSGMSNHTMLLSRYSELHSLASASGWHVLPAEGMARPLGNRQAVGFMH